MKIYTAVTKVISLLLLITIYPFIYGFETKPPRLTVIVIVDQLAYHYLPHLEHHLSGGIKFLLVNGIRYSNAYWPHAMPATSIGHTGLNTGTFANYHGILGNSWRDQNLQKICCDYAPAKEAAVFSADGLYSYGKSAKNIMVDGVSDQLILESRENAPITVFSFSYKSRSAICCASKLGKAIWFDSKKGNFTSSKAYFKQLPDWLIQFNKKNPVKTLMKKPYKLFHPKDSPAYSYVNNTTVACAHKENTAGENSETPYKPFIQTIAANELLLDLAKAFLERHLTKNKDQRTILWISLSSLDKLCHHFGPQSIETIDMIYHLDYQLKRFLNFIRRRIKQSDVLYVLTSDHGIEPAPEYLQKKGISSARRILIPQLNKEIEEYINKKYGIVIKCSIKVPQVYLDKTFDTLPKEQQHAILNDIKEFLERQEGIKKAWTYHNLINKCINKDQIEYYYKNQQFPGRSGLITFQVFPYVQMTKHQTGTAHRTPYEWNTHVPLIFYQKGAFEHKIINDRIWMLQFANSLAQIHKIPKPSASTCALLPGLFPAEDVSY